MAEVDYESGKRRAESRGNAIPAPLRLSAFRFSCVTLSTDFRLTVQTGNACHESPPSHLSKRNTIMSKFFTKLTIATLGLTLTIGTWNAAFACPRGGGGGYYNSYSAPRYNYNHNYRPVHVRPRPVQIAPQQQVQFSPQQQQLQFSAPQQQQQPLQALGGQQSVAGGQQQVQQAGGQQFQQSGGQSVQQTQFTSQQQQQRGVAPSQQVAQQPANNAPAAQNNAAAQAQLSAQQSALQALSAFGVEDAEASNSVTPDQQTEVAFHVGSWTAVLANNVTVQLVLQADGAFRWTANANGKSSSFEGTYSVNDGSLQLSRASDNQQLSGSFARTNSGGFNFKLQGKDDAGLNFARN
jgi:hypothetical protein